MSMVGWPLSRSLGIEEGKFRNRTLTGFIKCELKKKIQEFTGKSYRKFSKMENIIVKPGNSFRKRIFSYALTSFAFSFMNSVFTFYYVKIFLNVYRIQENWFHISQVIFMVWNAINDPMFAYIQDKSQYKFVRTRRESILYAAPFFSLSFLIPWFPWASSSWITGIHLIISLCLYDAMFTFIGLAHCCLNTEMSHEQKERLQLIQFAELACLFGSSSVFIFFHRTFISNFAAIILDQLIPASAISTFTRSVFYGAINILPQILVIIGAPLVAHIGYYYVILGNIFCKIIFGVIIFIVGPSHPWIFMAILLLESTYTFAASSLFNMPLSDIADENALKYNRQQPISSMIYGTNALVVKPAISLSPMLVEFLGFYFFLICMYD
ncbi:unnamed protein product [Acanthosepion pharaonis]|uniref:Uncharacterized protein n=1 Tax=Acanthosepion pharaonis TaxID=158019 RepID=A0A812DRS5_ACAPH|nr:unnamed protein product [Sepia pharaonis]